MGNKFWETEPSLWDSINNAGLRYEISVTNLLSKGLTHRPALMVAVY